MTYDTGLFIDIIEGIPNIIPRGSDHKNGVHVRFYIGLKGRLVIIDTSHEEITDDMGRGYLTELGLEHLIPMLFPPDPPMQQQ